MVRVKRRLARKWGSNEANREGGEDSREDGEGGEGDGMGRRGWVVDGCWCGRTGEWTGGEGGRPARSECRAERRGDGEEEVNRFGGWLCAVRGMERGERVREEDYGRKNAPPSTRTNRSISRNTWNSPEKQRSREAEKRTRSKSRGPKGGRQLGNRHGEASLPCFFLTARYTELRGDPHRSQ